MIKVFAVTVCKDRKKWKIKYQLLKEIIKKFTLKEKFWLSDAVR